MTQDIATVKNKQKKEKERRGKRKKPWLHHYWYITLPHIQTPFYVTYIYIIIIYIHNHIHNNIFSLWQLGPLDFNLAAILRNEKFPQWHFEDSWC